MQHMVGAPEPDRLRRSRRAARAVAPCSSEAAGEADALRPGGIGVCVHTRPASVGRPRLQGDECLQKQRFCSLQVTRCRPGSNQRFGLPCCQC